MYFYFLGKTIKSLFYLKTLKIDKLCKLFEAKDRYRKENNNILHISVIVYQNLNNLLKLVNNNRYYKI